MLCPEASGEKRTEEERTVTLARGCWQWSTARTEVTCRTAQYKGHLEDRGPVGVRANSE